MGTSASSRTISILKGVVGVREYSRVGTTEPVERVPAVVLQRRFGERKRGSEGVVRVTPSPWGSHLMQEAWRALEGARRRRTLTPRRIEFTRHKQALRGGGRALRFRERVPETRVLRPLAPFGTNGSPTRPHPCDDREHDESGT